MACTGVGGNAGFDDARFGNKHNRQVFDQKEILALSAGTMPVKTAAPKIEVRERRDHSVSGTNSRKTKVLVKDLDFFYGRTQALHKISIEVPERIVMAFIGPSGCGKSTFLRTLNRMKDVMPATRVSGEVMIDERDIYAPGTDVVELRRKVGMVFQKSNPFPKSIFDNVAYGLRINRLTSTSSELADRVEQALKDAALWEEVKDRLKTSAL